VYDARSARSSSSLSCDAASAPWNGSAVTDSRRARESVGDNVVLSRYMSYVGGELGCEIGVDELPR
jgi:hypothetical protein